MSTANSTFIQFERTEKNFEAMSRNIMELSRHFDFNYSASIFKKQINLKIEYSNPDVFDSIIFLFENINDKTIQWGLKYGNSWKD